MNIVLSEFRGACLIWVSSSALSASNFSLLQNCGLAQFSKMCGVKQSFELFVNFANSLTCECFFRQACRIYTRVV
uniref:Uncharacterized protein n=1 Tax=Arundo donax TaxID=35708 RepID=A0A0A8Z7A8_ARUDO